VKVQATVPTTAEAWVALIRVRELVVDHLDATLRREFDISFAEHDVLVQLMVTGGSLQMGEIARALVISKSGVTRLVGKLEQQGLIERVTYPQDRRATFATLTDDGRSLLERAHPVYLAVLDELFAAPLSATDTSDLHRALGKVLTAQGWSPPSPCAEWARQPAT
jgi:DNA-binding MarR family transcriptional regulator